LSRGHESSLSSDIEAGGFLRNINEILYQWLPIQVLLTSYSSYDAIPSTAAGGGTGFVREHRSHTTYLKYLLLLVSPLHIR